MADGRQRFEWQLAYSAMTNARLSFANPRHVSVDDLVPSQYRGRRSDDREQTPEQVEAMAEGAWEGLGAIFFGG